MPVNIWQNAIALTAFATLALLGGRLLAAAALARTPLRRVGAILGVIGCIAAFIAVIAMLKGR